MGGVERPIIIVGGGIGGLASAVALQRQGRDVAVFEQAPELLEIGAGISVWPNATRVLKQLGLLPDVLARSEVLERLHLRTWNGELLSDVRTVARFDTPAVCMHRAALLALLADQIPRECVHLGERFQHYDARSGVVIASLAQGRQVEGRALIGADGLHSTVRAQILGPSKPIHRGYWACRGIAAFTLPERYARTATETWGRGQRFGMEPMTRGRVFWYATANAPEGALGDRASWKDDLRVKFGRWHSPIPDLIEATEPGAILKHDIVDRPPARPWGEGHVTLLGDAAHATTPNLGQGACMAIEDALVLAQCLSSHRPIDAGLREYESRRFRRTAYMTRASRRVGRLGQVENTLAVALRSAMLKALPTALMDAVHRSYYRLDT